MMRIRYTRKEYEDAMELLRQRIESELSMTHDVDRLLEEYAGYIIHALSIGASKEDIELLIEDLVMRIIDDCRTLSVDNHDVDEDVIDTVFVGGDISVEERIRTRAGTFLDELTTAYSAGEILHMDEKSILASVVGNMEDPWGNPIISEVHNMVERGEVSGNVSDYEERHYGKGIPVSSKTDIEFITTSAIAATWNEWEWRSAFAVGAIGYYIERGSSCPCEECQSHTGRFYPISDKGHLPQYHRSCRCFVVYCYDKEDVIDLINNK